MKRSVLLIFAHPDDESFYAAGTVLRCRGEGASVTLICATRGQRGRRGDPEICSAEALGRVREAELRAAARVLGIEGLHFLDYVDQQLGSAPPEDIRTSLVRHIRTLRPDVIISFDPNGGSGHADHIAISRFAMDAAVAAADRRFSAELPAYAVPRFLWTPAVQPWRLAAALDSGTPAGIDILLDIADLRVAKTNALHCHRTQTHAVHRIFLAGDDAEMRLRYEAFRQVWGPEIEEPPALSVFAGFD